MKIAIDIDKTIFNCNSVLYQMINTYLINQNLNKDLKYKEVDLNEYKAVVGPIIKHISRMHNPNFYKAEKQVSNIMNKWVENGDEIILLSSRPAFKSLVGALLICLIKYNIPFTKLVVSCNNKAIYCKEKNIDVLIDDSHYICNNAKEIGIDTIWYIARYNDSDNIPLIKDLKTAKSWMELNSLINNKRNHLPKSR